MKVKEAGRSCSHGDATDSLRDMYKIGGAVLVFTSIAEDNVRIFGLASIELTCWTFSKYLAAAWRARNCL